MNIFYYCDFADKIAYNWQNNFYNLEKELLNSEDITFVGNIYAADLVFFSGYSNKLKNKFNLAKKLKKKIVYHALNINMNDFKYLTFFERRFINKIIRYCKKSDLIIVDNLELRDKLIYLGIKKKISYINSIVSNEWSNIVNINTDVFIKSARINNNQKAILGIGSQQWEGGIFDFVELSKQFKDIKFVWLNNIENEIFQSDIKQLIEKESLDNFIYLGYSNDMIFRQALKFCSIIMFIDYGQSRSLKIFQALNFKKPVILRNINSKNDIELINGINCYKGNSNEDFKWFINTILKGESSIKETEIEKLNEIYKIKHGKSDMLSILKDFLNN